MIYNLEINIRKPIRVEGYNFKSTKCQEYFKEITTNTFEFSSCFESKEPFQKQVNKMGASAKKPCSEGIPKNKILEKEIC